MIILKHLTVERFRLLREINVHFPQRGSILIQGPNEAGKSALLESIYFALYGTSLAADRGQRTLDDLILYGAAQASVTLILSIGTTEVSMSRSIERGKGQKVALLVRRPGMPEEEPITELAAANERIIAELGHMDGQTLRNSYLIEQKGLHLLENLRGGEREAAISKLLGLEELLSLSGRFILTPEDERMLSQAGERLELAEMQARIPTLSQQLDQIEAALDAVAVCEDLAEIDLQERDIVEQKQALRQIATGRAKLRARQHRIEQLRKADTILAEIIAAYESIAEARREIPELDQQIAELDHREREELPALEKRVSELVDLIRSFGTLERMSNDLLTSVSTVKELEQQNRLEQKRQREIDGLDVQITTARQQVEQARQSFHELEERRRSARPQLEARLQRLRGFSDRLAALQRSEEEYVLRSGQHSLAEENNAQLEQTARAVQSAEEQLARAEAEAGQAQQQTSALEKRWNQLNVGAKLEEWQRVKVLSQNITQTEQHFLASHQGQARLRNAREDANRAATKWMFITLVCAVAASAFLIVAVFAFFRANSELLGAALVVFALAALFGAVYFFQSYRLARAQLQSLGRQEQKAINQVGQAAAARAKARRSGGNQDALVKLEQEIRALDANVPRSSEEARYFVQQFQQSAESLADLQQKLNEQRNASRAADDAVKARTETLTALRNERARLQELGKKEHWDDLESYLRAQRIAIQDKQHEIAALAGQEGLPIPSVDAPAGRVAPMPKADLTHALKDAIKASEEEIGSLDTHLNSLPELAAQVKLYQDALDLLLVRKQSLLERMEPLRAQDLAQEIARTREQQQALRSALQNVQDSLRQRVKPLGVAFGQAAISNAEAATRKQLEGLHFTLGMRVELQSRRDNYAAVLKEQQDSLADHYNQLAKFSGSLGSWIVPLNPFAEALTALRARCQQEIGDAAEESILQELEKLRVQESASNAKIELCRQDIADAKERIAAMLAQHNRPPAGTYTLADITTIWPLLGTYTSQDREHLEEERATAEQALHELEQQEMQLSEKLQTGSNKLDLEQARQRMQQQERSYETKKRGGALLQAVNERLQQKMLPRTEYFMQQILPLLTSGRYHEVHFRTESEEGAFSGGPFQLQIWDTSAGEYVSTSALSGGAADQISLALRLAFAIATLPRDLAAAPGFVLLDEPLSSFDRGRAQALVDVITGESLGQHFEQVLLISHSAAFDPAMFPYHIYLEGGAVVESNLPVVPNFQSLAAASDKDASNGSGKLTQDDVDTTAAPLSASLASES